MRTLLYAVALAAGSAVTRASPLPDIDDLAESSGSHPVAQVSKEELPAMIQEVVPENHWVTVAKARKNLEIYDNFIMNQPRVNVSLYAMSRCPDAVSAA